MVRLSRTTRTVVFVVFALLLTATLTRNAWLPLIGEYLVYTTGPCKADIIVVLAGDYEGNRIRLAGDLQRKGWAPLVLVSGSGQAYEINEGDLAIQFAVRHGYSEAAFSNLPTPGRSTEAEAVYMVRELRRRGVHRFVLVTSDYHTHRATEVYRKASPDIPFCVVAAPDQDFAAKTWWHTREGRKTTFFEWCKTVAYLFHI